MKMKLLTVLALVLATNPVFASQLVCRGSSVYVRADFEGRSQSFSDVLVKSGRNALRFPSAELDVNYRPRNPSRDMVQYQIMSRANVRSGLKLLLPRVKGRSEFRGVLVGRDHEYHGEATYEVLTCLLNY
jgi:hypothetical protein